jgi:hypothetical protein
MHPWATAFASRWGLQLAFADRVVTWWLFVRRLGLQLSITSGRRSTEQQAELFRRAKAGSSKFPAARPGHSMHERGLAVDVRGSSAAIQLAGRYAPYFGLLWGGLFRRADPIHIELAR